MNLVADTAIPTTKPVTRRWRPRFFLRTLLLFVLTIGSAATLWWNWGPWHLAYVIEEPAPIIGAGFSPDGKFVYTVTDPNANGDEWGELGTELTLRNARSGEVVMRKPTAGRSEYVKFSPAGDIAMLHNGGISCGDFIRGMWKIDSGEPIQAPPKMPHGFITFAAAGGYAAGRAAMQTEGMIVSLPEWKKVRDVEHFLGFANRQAAYLDADTQRTVNVIEPKSTVHLITLPNMATERSWDVDGFVQAAWLSPDDSVIAINVQASPEYKVLLFDAATGAQLAATTGTISRGHDSPFAGDGGKLSIWDNLKSQAKLWDLKTNTNVPAEPPQNGAITPERAITGRDGKTLIDLKDVRWRKRLTFPIRDMQIDAAETACLVYSAPGVYKPLPLDTHAAVFRRSGTDSGVGLAWRPEFWMTVVLAGGLVWSVSKRR